MPVVLSVSMDTTVYARIEKVRAPSEAGYNTAAYLRTLLLEAAVLREAAAAKAALPPPRPTMPDLNGREPWEKKALKLKHKEELAAWNQKWGKAVQS